VSPETRVSQTEERTGARWEVYYELPALKREDADIWLAFLAKLKGRAGRFYGPDPSHLTPRGSVPGSPQVNAADQTGSSLITDGWTGSQSNIFYAGDLIAYDVPTGMRSMHVVTAPVNSDSGGNATLPISPKIRESPANNETIITTNPTCSMMLIDDRAMAFEFELGGFYFIAFTGIEAFWQ
jgi:hypothetical protein